MTAQRHQREDVRALVPGTWRHYLIELYPEGLDYTGKVVSRPSGKPPTQLHLVERDQGRYLQTDGLGRPDLDPELLANLDGVPRTIVKETIERARALPDTHPPADDLIYVLENYHKHNGRHTQTWLGDQLGVSQRTISGYLSRAIALVREQLPDDHRVVAFRLDGEAYRADFREVAHELVSGESAGRPVSSPVGLGVCQSCQRLMVAGELELDPAAARKVVRARDATKCVDCARGRRPTPRR